MAGLLVAALFDVRHQNAVSADSHIFVFTQFARSSKPGIQVRLKGLANDKFLDRADGMADEVDVFVLQLGAKQRSGDHREGHLHQVGVDIDGAGTDLPVEIPQRLGERVLHDRGQSIKLLSIEALLDKPSLRAPGFAVGRQKPLPQEVAHPFYLNLGFLVIFRVGLQYMLNDRWIGRNDDLFETTQVEPECVAEAFRVVRQNVYGVPGHRRRIHKGAKAGDRGYR